MKQDLVRALVGLPAALLLPFAISPRGGRLIRVALSLVLGALVLAPSLDTWEAWVLLAVLVACQFAQPAGSPILAGIGVLVLVGASSILLDWDAAWDGIREVVENQDVVIVASGAIFTIFVAGGVIGALLRPFAEAVKDPTESTAELQNAGLYIGWLERGLLYALVIGGAPQAAALVIAAKSVARFPSFQKEKFAEYYLIGTLASVLIALIVGVAVRASIGAHPLFI